MFLAAAVEMSDPCWSPQGKPKPVVSWLKDGQPVDMKRVNIRNSNRDSILFIRSAQREDSGVYEMSVKVDSLEDKVTLTLQIVGESEPSMLKDCACNRRIVGLSPGKHNEINCPPSCWSQSEISLMGQIEN